MPTLSADLELLVDQALQNVQAIDEELTRIAANFSDSMAAGIQAVAGELNAVASVNVTADTTEGITVVESFIGDVDAQQAAVAVAADTTDAGAGVQALVDQIDSDTASLTVDADTTEAQAAVDDLSGSVDNLSASGGSAQQSMHATGISAGELGGLAGLATGEVGGLSESSGLFGEHAAVAAGGALALGVGIGEIAKAGFTAVSAEERFTAALGAQAEAVKNVQVGSLTADLFTLGAQFGSTEAAMQNATSGVFQFAKNSGAGDDEARQFADGIAAISARAVAVNPNVGTTADVMERAAIGIGRARTAASLLNVGLSTTEVNTAAAAIAQQRGEESATAYDKSLAALQITVEKFGPSLKAQIADGAENASNKAKAAKADFENALESFAKPLVAPALDLIKAVLPVAKDFGAALADVASVAIPLLTAALDVLGPVIEPVLAGFLAFKAFELGTALYNSLLLTAAGWGLLGDEAATEAAVIVAAGETAAAGEAAATGGLSLVVGAAVAAGVAIVTLGGDTDNTTDSLHKMSGELAKASDASLFRSFEGAATIHALGADVSITTARLQDFKVISNDNVGTGQRLLDVLNKQGISTKGYQEVLDKAVQSQKDQAKSQADTKATADALLSTTDTQAAALRAAKVALDAYNAGTGSASDALKAETAAQKEQTDALSLYKDQLLAVQGVQGDVTAAQIALANAQQRTFDALGKNGNAFDINTQAGRDNVSSLQAQISAQDALSEAIFKQTGNRQAADESLNSFTTTLETNLISLTGNKEAADALLTSLGLVPPAAAPATDALSGLGAAAGSEADQAQVAAFLNAQAAEKIKVDTFLATQSAIASLGVLADTAPVKAGEAGEGAHSKFKEGVDKIPAAAGGAVTDAGGKVTDAGAQLSAQSGPAFVAGLDVGASFVGGMAAGVDTFAFEVAIAAVNAVAAAEAAARTAAKSHSPSELFAEIGRDLALGMAAGIDGESAAVKAASATLVDEAAAGARTAIPASVGAGQGSVAGSGPSGPTVVAATGAAGPVIGQQVNNFNVPVPDPAATTRDQAEATRTAMFLAGAL